MSDNFFRIKNGLSLGNIPTDPGSGINGDTYYNTTSDTVREFVDGAWRDAVQANSTQTLTNKTLSFVTTDVITDNTTTGAAATLATSDITVGDIRLTNASLLSVSGIPAGIAGQQIIVQNLTGTTINLNNQDAAAAAANQISTGIGANVSMPNTATYTLIYDATVGNWMLIGANGSAAAFNPPIDLTYITTGTVQGFIFDVSAISANVLVGATYIDSSNVGAIYTVLYPVNSGGSGYTLACSVSGTTSTPVPSTLTLSSSPGTGPVTITFSTSVPLTQAIIPSSPSPLYFDISLVGGGGSGGGTGNNSGGGGGGSGAGMKFKIPAGANMLYYNIGSGGSAELAGQNSYFVSENICLCVAGGGSAGGNGGSSGNEGGAPGIGGSIIANLGLVNGLFVTGGSGGQGVSGGFGGGGGNGGGAGGVGGSSIFGGSGGVTAAINSGSGGQGQSVNGAGGGIGAGAKGQLIVGVYYQ